MGQADNPRKHHFLPRCYLAGFTPSGSQDDFLWVFPRDGGPPRRQRVAEVAHVRDFYRVDDVEGVNPNTFEGAFAELEGRVAPVLRDVADSQELPTDTERWSLLVTFIALMGARTPRARAALSRIEQTMANALLRTLVSDPRIYAAQVAKLGLKDAPTYDEMRDFVENERYTIELPNARNVLALTEAQKGIFEGLAGRTWAVYVAEDEAEFITSDDPVLLDWIDPSLAPPGPLSPPGFGLKGTEVLFPVSRRVTMLGVFGRLPGRRAQLFRNQVARVNTRLALRGIHYSIASSAQPMLADPAAPDGPLCTVERAREVFRKRPIPRTYRRERAGR